MTFQTLTIDSLHDICGGQQAAQAAQPSPQPSVEDRARQIAREEIDSYQQEREHDEFRAWEKRHPFSAFACQGDRSCMR